MNKLEEKKTDKKKAPRDRERDYWPQLSAVFSRSDDFSPPLPPQSLYWGPTLNFYQVRLFFNAGKAHYIQSLRDVGSCQEVSHYRQSSLK